MQRAISNFTQAAFGPLIDRLGFDYLATEPFETSELRTLAFSTVGAVGYLPLVKCAAKMFEQFVKGGHSSVHPNLRRAVLSIVSFRSFVQQQPLRLIFISQAVSNGGKQAYDAMVDLFKKLSPSV